jgi:hypothetical protein
MLHGAKIVAVGSTVVPAWADDPRASKIPNAVNNLMRLLLDGVVAVPIHGPAMDLDDGAGRPEPSRVL